jgi:excinuclease ABC subunit A
VRHPGWEGERQTNWSRRIENSHSLIIKHNLDVIKTADWVIDLGPEGGAGGGRIVAQGPPEAIAACAASHTGRFLSRALTPAQR